MMDPETVDWSTASSVSLYGSDKYTYLDTPGAGPSTVQAAPETRWANAPFHDGYRIDGTYGTNPYYYPQSQVQYPMTS